MFQSTAKRIGLLVMLLACTPLTGCDDEPATGDDDTSTIDAIEDRAESDQPDDTPVDQALDSAADLSDAAVVDGEDADVASVDADSDVEEAAEACWACHGTSESAAPPPSLSGATSTSETGVGAHREHLRDSTWRAPIACDECHLVPQIVSAVGHIDTALPAEVLFGERATDGGASPEWDGEVCSNVYCHGATLGATGTNTEPIWTTVDGSQAACGTCHGDPPGPPHPDSDQCSDCHRTMAVDGSFLHPERHIDGAVEAWWLPCDVCHGSDGNPAPPADIAGNTDPEYRGVGAHRSHLGPSDWHLEVACDECHIVPELMDSPGHRDTDLPAEVDFGPLADAGDSPAEWTGERCTNTYCHGASLRPDGTATEPVWTKVDGSQSTCTSCHGFPPSGDHPDSDACSACHPTLNPDSSFANADQHIDGTLQVVGSHPEGWSNPAQHGATFNAEGPTACTTCHGDLLDGGLVDVSCDTCHSGWQTDCTFCHGGEDNSTGAPPLGVDGEASRADLEVGAHTLHVEQTAIHATWDCSECHATPTSALSSGHIDGDGQAEIDFGGLNPSGTYSFTTGACTNMYCHGDGQRNAAAPNWDTDPTIVCSSCHDDQTQIDDLGLSGEHKKHLEISGVSCVTCHSTTVSGANVIIGLEQHVDGEVQISFTGGISMSFSSGSCSGVCHSRTHSSWQWND